MSTVGIICEYNPFHNGHLRQLKLARAAAGEEGAVVCLMSGNYVQRGAPAIFQKQVRASAAVCCGADLVLELPLTVALSSAEGFAAGGVSILTALGCDLLCYGTESADNEALMQTARANLDPAFDELVCAGLQTGCAYAVARQRALERLGAGAGLSSPNDILAVEYCKALLRQKSPMRPLPIRRTGSYNTETLDSSAPSAAAIRAAVEAGRSDWTSAVPSELLARYAEAPVHTWAFGERAVLARVRTLSETCFAALPYGSEGLWRRLMRACRSCDSVEEILQSTKSKRYSRTRLQRMLLCAYLGLTGGDLQTPPPYVRILGFNGRGRTLLRDRKRHCALVNAGQTPPDPVYYDCEVRAGDLYSLFSAAGPRPAGEEARLRVYVSASACR